MFIDPYLDPKKANYKEFGALLVHAAGFGTKPRVEIHRSCRDSSGQDTRSEFPKRNEWQGRFNPLIKSLAGHGIKVRIFIWKDFHDRYLISNLIGISVPHGFDICLNGRRHSIRTTWTRLSRRDAREVQRDFDADAERDRLHYEPFP